MSVLTSNATAISTGLPVMQYVRNIRFFRKDDWLRFVLWMGSLLFLLFGVSAFLLWGVAHGVRYPGYVFFIPIGTLLFVAAVAIDDIGHRTLYKEDLAKGEGAVHHMIIATAMPSVVALCLCYENPETFKMPALVLLLLSLFYTAIDEAMHWVRYMQKGLDKVEMWAHFTITLGHVLMMSVWWQWYDNGYPGVAETVATFPF